MRRILGIIIVCVAAAALLVVAPGAEEGEDYKVRAIFDNAAFVAPGMDVRIAGANVGSVAELDVTFPGEPARLDGSDEPGKAVVVLADQRRRLPGLPPGRLLPDLLAVAPGREVRRVPAHAAPGGRAPRLRPSSK